MDLVKGEISREAGYELKFEDGKLKALAHQEGDVGGAKVEIYLKADAVVEALKKAIPGTVDDVVFDLILAKLQAQKAA